MGAVTVVILSVFRVDKGFSNDGTLSEIGVGGVEPGVEHRKFHPGPGEWGAHYFGGLQAPGVLGGVIELGFFDGVVGSFRNHCHRDVPVVAGAAQGVELFFLPF